MAQVKTAVEAIRGFGQIVPCVLGLALDDENVQLKADNAALKAENDSEVSALQSKLDDVLARLSKLENNQGE